MLMVYHHHQTHHGLAHHQLVRQGGQKKFTVTTLIPATLIGWCTFQQMTAINEDIDIQLPSTTQPRKAFRVFIAGFTWASCIEGLCALGATIQEKCGYQVFIGADGDYHELIESFNLGFIQIDGKPESTLTETAAGRQFLDCMLARKNFLAKRKAARAYYAPLFLSWMRGLEHACSFDLLIACDYAAYCCSALLERHPRLRYVTLHTIPSASTSLFAPPAGSTSEYSMKCLHKIRWFFWRKWQQMTLLHVANDVREHDFGYWFTVMISG